MRITGNRYVLLFILTAALACGDNNKSLNMKDLDDNMIDMRMYHDNLGTHLRKNEIDYSRWLLEGMDSMLLVISDKFTEHRKLKKPFRHHYEKSLQPSIREIREALDNNDLQKAVSSYKILTQECNDCHKDHDVDKQVEDWTLPGHN